MKWRVVVSLEFETVDALERQARVAELAGMLQRLAPSFTNPAIRVTERRLRLRPRAPAPIGVFEASVSGN